MSVQPKVEDNGMGKTKGINFLITGVGGQGALLASSVLAEVGVRAGYDVKKAEVHGMSQRGGSVFSHVRWGEKIDSPVIGRGKVDYLLALEKLEALRYLPMLRPGGTAVVGELKIPPLSVSSGSDHYPDDKEMRRMLEQVTDNYYFVPTLTLAEEAGNARAHNVVLLGALSTFVQDVPPDGWLKVVEERVPEKYVEVNRRAFQAGRRAGLSGE
jgi:indolepyruvate ferredoxin oxidoreductase beta subunit